MNHITDWLENIYGVEAFSVTITEISFPCPKCGKGDKHFQFNTEKNIGHCFRCGWRTTLIGLIAEIAGVSKKRAKELIRHHGVRVTPSDTYEKPKPPPFEPCTLPPNTGWTTRAKEYLEHRNVSDQMIHKYGLYYCGTGKFQGRIIMPVIMDGICVSFQARTVFPDVKKRYDNPHGINMARCLYGYNLLPDVVPNLVVVEGPFDAIAVDSLMSIYHRPVACFGKSISEEQMDLLSKVKRSNIILAFDSDADVEGMWRLLTLRFNCVKVVIFTTGDPAECKDLEGRLRKASRNLNDAKYWAASQTLNLSELRENYQGRR